MTRLGLQQVLFTGEKGKSFSESGSGLGTELVVMRDGEWFTPFLKARALAVSGKQEFRDGDGSVSSKFLFYQGQADLGIYLYPLKRRRQGFNVYLGGAGSLAYNHVSLEQSAELTKIPHTDHGFSSGYSGSIGGEWIFGARSANRWSLSVEIIHRQDRAVLLRQAGFDLGSTAVCLGLGW